ncbi:hypothetical protein [Erythrobacter ani]|uniref:ABC transporter permease n=1 Tax=Erythrobacter ani TaxID=2827235 RepID=A0ABS6SP93_9SPHN|nr:hypothetical protein [Erythrobacter ani]MBV7266312.1 hypothetical protein [Erythrobacter ani]
MNKMRMPKGKSLAASDVHREVPSSGKRSFARGFLFALPGAIALWGLIAFLI